jgi:uncharacterized caspase-like protein
MAKVALLIGVSEYGPGLNALSTAVKDIEAMQRVLNDPELGGFDMVKKLPNPDPQTMQYEIETFFSGTTKDDLVLLFFSGHGIKDERGRLFFATPITCKNNKGDLILSTAVPASFVHDIMNNCRCKRQAIILDCCFSGAFDPALQSKSDPSVDLLNELGTEGRVVLTSSSSTEYSFAEAEAVLSIYTRYLVEGIETGAGDRNEDGFVSVLELHEYATSKVQETAPKMTPKIITLKDKGFDIVLSKARVADPKLIYRKAASMYASAGSIRPVGRAYLDTLKQQRGLTDEVASEIEAEVLRPYRERLANLEKYRKALLAEAESEYPFSEETCDEINRFQELLGLRDEDILTIRQAVEKQFSQKAEMYQQYLVQYKQAFTEAIQQEFPLSQNLRQTLENLQASLDLRHENIVEIERPLIQQAELSHRDKAREVAEQKQRAKYENKLKLDQRVLQLRDGDVAKTEARATSQYDDNSSSDRDLGLPKIEIQKVQEKIAESSVIEPQSSTSPLSSTPLVKATSKSSLKASNHHSVWPFLTLVTAAGSGIALGLLFWPKPTPEPAAKSSDITSTPPTEPALDTKSYWTVRRTFGNTSVSSTASFPVLDLKASPNKNSASLGIVANGVVFRILGSQKNGDPDQTLWYRVQLCGRLLGLSPGQSPTVSPSTQPRINPKSSVGYIPATLFQRVAVAVEPGQVDTLNLEGCLVRIVP